MFVHVDKNQHMGVSSFEGSHPVFLVLQENNKNTTTILIVGALGCRFGAEQGLGN